MTRLAVALLLLVLALPSPTPLARDDGEHKQDVQSLYYECVKKPPTDYTMFCVAYISGVADMMNLNGVILLKTEPTIVTRIPLSNSAMCGEISYGAMVQAFTNWAQKHPEKWNDKRLFGVAAALHETWPCH